MFQLLKALAGVALLTLTVFTFWSTFLEIVATAVICALLFAYLCLAVMAFERLLDKLGSSN